MKYILVYNIILILQTRKRSRAQRVTRPVCANATVHFLLPYRLTMLLPPSSTVYISLLAVTTHANAPQVVRVYRSKVQQICSSSNFFMDGVNATIRIANRPPVVE